MKATPEEDAQVVDGLCRRPDRNAAVALRAANHGLGLHLRVVDLRGTESALDDHLRLREGARGVPFQDIAAAGDVALDLELLVAQQHAVVQGRRAGLHRLDGIGHDRQGLVFHPHSAHGSFGQRFRFGGDRRHCFAHTPHFVGQDGVVFM